MRNFSRVICLVAGLLGLFIPEAARANETLDSFWSAFRHTERFLAQDIVVSSPGADNTRVLLLTEPPSAALAADGKPVAELIGAAAQAHKVFRHRIGFDGWAQDVAVLLKDTDDVALQGLVAALSKTYYGSDHKASWRELEPKPWHRDRPMQARQGPPNLEISAASLNEWLFQSNVVFETDAAGDGSVPAPATLATLMQEARGGVYHSRTPGLVVLILHRERRLNDRRDDLRRFVVDTDAVLGAVQRQSSPILAILGRGRTTAIGAMPPLRVASILTLASAGVQDLAQSYERNAPFAGRIADPDIVSALQPAQAAAEVSKLLGDLASEPNGPRARALQRRIHRLGVDWAPILLSRELTNTEYGQILNITDQMLKDWSLAGSIRYAAFPYPAPPRYPHADGVQEELGVRLGRRFEQLTFNWNTAGFGAWTTFGVNEIFAVYRTGSLPITYKPENAGSTMSEADEVGIQKIEDEYWRFFANLRDPYLMRAAQYAALHMIFQRSSMKAEREEDLVEKTAYDRRWKGLSALTENALKVLSKDPTVGTNQSRRTTANQAPHCYANLPDSLESVALVELNSAAANPERLEDLSALMSDRFGSTDRLLQPIMNRRTGLVADYSRFKAEADDYNKEAGRCRFGALGCSKTEMSARKERLERQDASLEQRSKVLDADYADFLNRQKAADILAPVVAAVGDCREAWKAVRDGAPVSEGSTQKTPSIVVSASPGGVGGHNLDGRSVSVSADVRVRQGTVGLDIDKGAIRLNPDDMANSQHVAREFERSYKGFSGGDVGYRTRVEKRVASALADARPAVAFGDVSLGRLPQDITSVEPGRRYAGAQVVSLPPARIAALQAHAERHQASVVIYKVADGVVVTFPGGRPPKAFQTRSQDETQRIVEELVKDHAQAAGPDAQSIAIVSEGAGVSVRDLMAIKLSAEARATQSAGGGGGGLPPEILAGGPAEPRDPGRDWRFGILAQGGGGDGKPPKTPGGQDATGPSPQPGGDGRGTSRLRFDAVYGRGTTDFAHRRDVDWRKATVSVTQTATASMPGGQIVARLEVRFKTVAVEDPISIEIRTFFKRRAPSAADESVVREMIEAELNIDGVSATDKANAIRRKFLDKFLAADPVVRSRLRQGGSDIYIVKRNETKWPT